ncbi:alpha-N-acetylgalactosaminide alpha-2,6-sialyltransferase 6 isoform X1 [Corythoichthys intestinalis]|uniref:alpha-N-acetylgalactosaminide alpha-2,6-sialyltransferase 6 isoform X1 n=1 Tax=Corythoichthys intestinalis TaxID=161448 RepID=UPI0025A5804D|nr:alpha-N-acetylgalactosaminide alpha-2,6-sialyltransferase 6 isoform X1 [Corythoichthys intestinalis]
MYETEDPVAYRRHRILLMLTGKGKLSGQAIMAGERTRRVAIFVAVFIVMTLLILYNSGATQSSYLPFQVAKNHTPKPTNLKKWATKDYVAVHGDKRMNLHCQQCALVTSSSHVLGTKAGELIDSSECVIRMNDAPTAKYETDVGKRTTLRVVAHSSVYRVLRRHDDYIVDGGNSRQTIIFWGPPNKMTKDSKATVYRAIQKICSTYKNVSCFTVAPAKMYRFDNLFQLETGQNRQRSNSWLSTGWFTMVIAIEICDNIQVYGMVPPNFCSTTKGSNMLPYHYYKPRGSDECVTFMQSQNNQKGSHHRFITEKQVFGHWAQQYNITFHHPTW